MLTSTPGLESESSYCLTPTFFIARNTDTGEIRCNTCVIRCNTGVIRCITSGIRCITGNNTGVVRCNTPDQIILVIILLFDTSFQIWYWVHRRDL